MKILYIAPLTFGSTSLQRLRAFTDLGHDLVGIDNFPDWLRRVQRTLFYRIYQKIFEPPDLVRINNKIVKEVQKKHFDLVWIDKGLVVKPETLDKIKALSPKSLIVGYSPDDMAAKYCVSKNLAKSYPYYDIYFITRTCNVPELEALGCPRVQFIGKAYDPHTHRPMGVSPEDKERLGGPVGFIGSYEGQRAESIFHLAENGISVGVWGDGWHKCKLRSPNLIIKGPSILGAEYAKTIGSFDIVLGFLRKMNRDSLTSRSYEIPACGAFMLAERTREHLELFEEGKEAEFFETDEELLEKVRYYLDHEEERKRIAQAGRERCIKSGYSYQESLKRIIEIIKSFQRESVITKQGDQN